MDLQGNQNNGPTGDSDLHIGMRLWLALDGGARESLHAPKGKPLLVRFEMIRRLFYSSAALSMLLSVALFALWVRTNFAADDLAYYRALGPVSLRSASEPVSQGKYHIITSRGEVGLVISPLVSVPHAPGWQNVSGPMLPEIPTLSPRGGFGFYCNDGGPTAHTTTPGWGDPTLKMSINEVYGARFQYIFVPLWFLVVLTAIPPAVAFRKSARRRRVFAGYCAKCGYDLRATPDRCPECGARS